MGRRPHGAIDHEVADVDPLRGELLVQRLRCSQSFLDAASFSKLILHILRIFKVVFFGGGVIEKISGKLIHQLDE